MKPLEEMGRYATVVIDPPWALPPLTLEHRTAASGNRQGISVKPLTYKTLSLDEIGSLPIKALLADDAFLFCWTINSRLMHMADILSQWCIEYIFTMTWVKAGGINLPNRPQFNSEWCVVGRNGSPRFLTTKGFDMANYWPRTGHSEKPEGFYDLLRRVTLGPRLDIFGRRRIAGFDSWGDEAPDAPALPDHYQTVFDA